MTTADRKTGLNTGKPLWRIRPELQRLDFYSPSRARDIFDAFLDEINEYSGTPDMWHTIAMIAGRAQHYDARISIIKAGLREWPDDVDLLCELLQSYYGRASSYDPQLARETWKQLCELGQEVVSPYWRYWVYGAIYHARELNDSQTALDLLDQGLSYIRRADMCDIFRNYRMILVDSVPVRTLDNHKLVEQYQSWVLKTLEQKYTQGIALGVEVGYVLAAELAVLYQEQAGNTSEENDYLEKALFYLDLAERLYTGNPNHPIWDIYIVRIRIYMAQHKYGDALKILRSLPDQIIDIDPSLITMKTLCAHMTGESIEDRKPSEPDEESAIRIAVPALLRNGGDILQTLMRQNPALRTVISSIVNSEG